MPRPAAPAASPARHCHPPSRWRVRLRGHGKCAVVRDIEHAAAHASVQATLARGRALQRTDLEQAATAQAPSRGIVRQGAVLSKQGLHIVFLDGARKTASVRLQVDAVVLTGARKKQALPARTTVSKFCTLFLALKFAASWLTSAALSRLVLMLVPWRMRRSRRSASDASSSRAVHRSCMLSRFTCAILRASFL